MSRVVKQLQVNGRNRKNVGTGNRLYFKISYVGA